MNYVDLNYPKFILAPADELGLFYIIIGDFEFWVKNETAIHEWMEKCLPDGKRHQEGSVITFEHEHDVVNFMLRWS